MKYRALSPLVIAGLVFLLGALLGAAFGAHGLFLLAACVSLALFTAEGFLAVGLNRVGLALLVAPLSACAVLAALSPQEPLLVVVLLYTYVAGLAGIPAYFLFRKLRWLRFWRVVVGGAALGASVSWLLVSAQPPAFILRGAALGALCAAVFWLLAFAGSAQRSEA